jgi:hypothetical protein
MDMIQTNLGPMTPTDMCDELEYRRYRHHIIGLQVSHETMARWYGDVVADTFRLRLRAELEALNRAYQRDGTASAADRQIAAGMGNVVRDGIDQFAEQIRGLA